MNKIIAQKIISAVLVVNMLLFTTFSVFQNADVFGISARINVTVLGTSIKIAKKYMLISYVMGVLQKTSIIREQELASFDPYIDGLKAKLGITSRTFKSSRKPAAYPVKNSGKKNSGKRLYFFLALFIIMANSGLSAIYYLMKVISGRYSIINKYFKGVPPDIIRRYIYQLALLFITPVSKCISVRDGVYDIEKNGYIEAFMPALVRSSLVRVFFMHKGEIL